MKCALFFLAAVLLGCATVDLESMSEPERTAYLKEKEQKEYARIERRDIEHDKIRKHIAACRAAGGIPVYSGFHSTGRNMRKRRDPNYVGPHERLMDHSCWFRRLGF